LRKVCSCRPSPRPAGSTSTLSPAVKKVRLRLCASLSLVHDMLALKCSYALLILSLCTLSVLLQLCMYLTGNRSAGGSCALS
jgi:hypothetical protein